MSVFVLGSMISFASNDEKENKSEKLNIEIENSVTTESQDFFNHTFNYEIIAQIFVCGSSSTSINWLETASAPNHTGCVGATQLAAITSRYETLYALCTQTRVMSNYCSKPEFDSSLGIIPLIIRTISNEK